MRILMKLHWLMNQKTANGNKMAYFSTCPVIIVTRYSSRLAFLAEKDGDVNLPTVTKIFFKNYPAIVF